MRPCNCFLIAFVALGLGVPLPALAQVQYDTSPGAQTGVQMYGSYFSADVDTVNLYNGNVMLNLGLFSLPGRELSTGLNLRFNNQKWEQKTCPDGSGGSYVCGSQYTGGWRIANVFGNGLSVFSEITGFAGGWYLTQFNAYYIDAMGAKHRYQFEDWYSSPSYSFNSLTLSSIDGDRSKIVFGSNWSSNGQAHLYMANGSDLYFNGGSPYQFTTANGNYLINSTNGSKLPLKDTLGRTDNAGSPQSVVPYTAGTIGSTADTYTVKDSSGTDRTYSILYKTHSAFNPYTNSNETRGSDRTVIDTITLPNSKTWAFEYGHDQRFITKVTMPSGAYIRYEYYGGMTGHNAADDYITARKVSATGDSGDEKTWTYSRSGSGGTRTVTVTSPEGEVVVHTFNAQGQETSTVWKNSAGTTLKTVTTSWTQDSVQSNGQAANPRVTTVVTALDGGLSSTAAQTHSSGLLTEATVTAYGSSTVVSKKVLTYTTISGAVNRDALSTETIYGIDVSSGSLVVQGKKEYFYDNFSLTDRGTSVPNHTHSTSTTGRGNLTKVRVYKDASNYIETQTKYDNVGNVIETIDGLSHSTTVDFTDNFTARTATVSRTRRRSPIRSASTRRRSTTSTPDS